MPEPASVCDSAVPKKKRARPSLAGKPELSGVYLYEWKWKTVYRAIASKQQRLEL